MNNNNDFNDWYKYDGCDRCMRKTCEGCPLFENDDDFGWYEDEQIGSENVY